MSGQAGRNGGRGGRGNAARGARGRGRGYNYKGASSTTKKGLCTTLTTHVFDYGQKNAADLMKTSWDKLVQHVGTTYGQDIASELKNKVTVIVDEPVPSAAILTRHALREQVIRTGQVNILAARRAQEVVLQAAVTAGGDADVAMALVVLQNEMHRTNTKHRSKFRL